MFDINKFSVPVIKTIVLCKSDHPVAQYIKSKQLKRIPTKAKRFDGLFYVELKDDKGIVTYDETVKTMQYHNMTIDKLKEYVKSDTALPYDHEVINTLEINKWLGSDVMRLLHFEGVVESDLTEYLD